MRVVIVGAGLSGLTLASFLRRANIAAVVLERQSSLHGSYIPPYALYANALSCYRAFGVELPVGEGDCARGRYFGLVNDQNEWLCKMANRYLALRPLNQEDRVAMTTAPFANSQSVVSQRSCETTESKMGHVPLRTCFSADLLHKALRPHATEIKYNCNVIDVVPHDGYKSGMHVVLDNGHTEWGDVVVAADGVCSTLRARLHSCTQAPISRDGQFAVQVDGLVEDVLPELLPGEGCPVEMWGEGQRVSFVPFSRGERYDVAFSATLRPRTHALALCDDVRHASEESLPHIRTCLSDALTGFSPPIVEMLKCASRAVVRDVLEAPFLSRWYHRRVVFVGDAVHGVAPCFPHHDASLCVEDAALLTVALSDVPLLRDSGIQYVFHRYELARRDRVERYIRQARRVRRFSAMPRDVLRNAIVRVIPSCCIAHSQKWLTHWSFRAQQLRIDSRTRPETAFR